MDRLGGGRHRILSEPAILAVDSHADDSGWRCDKGLSMSSTWCHHRQPRAGRKVAHVATPAVLLAVWLGAVAVAQAQTSTLETVRQRGFVKCGVNAGLPGFSQSDDLGTWRGLDADYCKAIAAAVLGDPTKVNFVPTPRLDRFAALRSGEIDVLVRNTTWTSERDSARGLSFVGVNYYDGQAFLVKASHGLKSVKELNGAAICVGSGTTSELNLAGFFKANNMTYTPVIFDNYDDTVRAYLADRCAAYTADASSLYSVRVKQVRPMEHVLLPEIISKEPLGPSVRQGDPQWFTIVKWVHFALLNAEELGVTQANVAEMTSSPDPNIRRFLGTEGNFGTGLGLANDFGIELIKAVGNYGEIFERNLGSGSRLKIARGLNNLWSHGGLQYAPPVR
jgi:general L-amino acid transport system substrate-binding protein